LKGAKICCVRGRNFLLYPLSCALQLIFSSDILLSESKAKKKTLNEK
jgi:hypothetical protein